MRLVPPAAAAMPLPQPHIRPEGDERWIYVARRHWVALAWRAIVPFFVIVFATLGVVYRGTNREPDFLGREPALLDFLSILLLFLSLSMLLVLLYIYYDWRNDMLIVSNKRVIHEDRTLFLSFRYETIPLDRVQNVNILTEGLQKLFGYGQVTVQASGLTAPISFARAREPAVVQRQVMQEVGRQKREQEQARLRALVHKRVHPNAPAIEVPQANIEQDLPTTTSALGALLPFGPVLVNGTITWHRHWIVLLRKLALPTLALLVWIALLIGLPALGMSGPAVPITLFILLIFVLGFYAWQIDDWRNDLYVLDPSRIIDITRLPLGLFEDRREASLGAIQNVNSTSPNIIAQILGYGDVLIETAGSSGNLTFKGVPDPEQVQRMIFEYMDRFRWNQRERDWTNVLTIVEAFDQSKLPPTP